MSLLGMVAALVLAQSGEPAPFIGEFPLEDRAETKAGAGPLTLTVTVPAGAVAPPELGKRFKLTKLEGGALRFEARGYPESREKVTAQQKKPSFVIDYDEKPVQALHDRFAATGKAPSIDALVEFVDQTIVKKNLLRSFDYASVVARRGEGDCTEHAVLLAALSRSFGIPSRVVLGVALLETPKGLMAFGHAWTEYYAQKRWTVADAALRGITELQYLPLNVMEDETASFMGASLRQGSMMSVQSVRVEDAPKG